MYYREATHYDQFFVGRTRGNDNFQVPLGYDWFIRRIELLFHKKTQASELMDLAEKILEQSPRFISLKDSELYFQLNAYKELFRMQKESEEEFILAMAMICEISFRVRGQRPYKTQIAGALGLLKNCIIEMATGEGKTLTASLAAVVFAWRGKGCHVVTSNDYLAARDNETLETFYAACKVVSASITQDADPKERKKAYQADITYLTSKELLADFLKDQMTLKEINSQEKLLIHNLSNKETLELLQRGFCYAIVDEADSVLCDGGSIPLLLSIPKPNAPSPLQYQIAYNISKDMKQGQDYRVNKAFKQATLTDIGKKKTMQSLLENKNWAKKTRAIELITQALEAREFFQESVQYVLKDGKVIIIDEATGRIMPDHEWRDGMHQAVSAKENVEIIAPRTTSAQSTFQDFFLRYKTIGGMTGTALESKSEFLQFYRMFVVQLPTYKPILRYNSYTAIHKDSATRIADIIRTTKEESAKKRAVLIGTKSIEASEEISKALDENGIKHELLNALSHEREAEIIALAGKENAVTVATNMAGRGTDIKLDASVKESGGLHVILTEFNTSVRIDRQLYGRSGRQGDPGTSANIVSMEDDFFKAMPHFLQIFIKGLLSNKASKRLGVFIALKTIRLFQKYLEYTALSQRKSMLKANRSFADLISYSGKKD